MLLAAGSKVNTDEKFFFHSFPQQFGAFGPMRGPVFRSRMIECGITMMETTLRDGLLLTHETVPIATHADNQSLRRKSEAGVVERPLGFRKLDQVRACFTLCSIDDLVCPNNSAPSKATHTEIFGPFAIGLRSDPNTRVALELLPVHYYIGSGSNDRVSLAESLLVGLHEARELLAVLALLDRDARRSDPNLSPSDTALFKRFSARKIHLTDQRDAVKREVYGTLEAILSLETKRDILGVLSTDRRRLADLVQGIDLLLSTIQNTDSKSLTSNYLYYEQREWRMIRTINTALLGYPLSSDEPDRSGQRNRLRLEKQKALRRVAGLLDIKLTERIMRNFWVVIGSSAPRKPLRDFVGVLVCPRGTKDRIQREIVDQLIFDNPPDIVEVPYG